MGESRAIVELMTQNPRISDLAISKIISPSMMERFERSERAENLQKVMPPRESWRFSKQAGVVLDNMTQIVRCNHFNINPAHLPDTIYHYNIAVFKYNRQKEVSECDLSKEKDGERICTGILKQLWERHNHWHFNKVLINCKFLWTYISIFDNQ
jgi:hypothetical protein